MHDLLLEKLVNADQTINMFNLAVSIFGLIVSARIRRSKVYRVKLCMPFIFLFAASIGGLCVPFMKFVVLRDTLISAFIILITIMFWREIKSYMTTDGYHKKSLGGYIDDVPDLICVQDLDHQIMYANKSCMKAFNLKEHELLGKTEEEIQRLLAKKGIQYNSIQHMTGAVSLENPRIYLESKFIDGKYIALQVYEGLLYNNESIMTRKHVGYIYVGRDLTYDVQDHDLIAKHLKEGDMETSQKIFAMHRGRYEGNVSVFTSQKEKN